LIYFFLSDLLALSLFLDFSSVPDFVG